MLRILGVVCAFVVLAVPALAGDLKGDYMETRTCDVYTGPCFAMGQGGLTGKDAMMAWNIERGSFEGVSLAGLKVVIVLTATDTLGFGGPLVLNPEPIRSVIFVDETATAEQRTALAKFAQEKAEHAGEVVRVVVAPIDMSVDHFEVVGKLKVGTIGEILTRKLTEGDCVCRNEVVFYPPLCTVKNANPAYTIQGRFTGPALSSHWSNDTTRSSFLASFSY